MIQFVNTGLDETILKSLNAVTPDEDLCKAMNRQGMVQKEVQVKGKNGTFTRKQWVRASDVQSNSDSNRLSSYEGKTDAEMRVLFDGKTATDAQKEKARIFASMGKPMNGDPKRKEFERATGPINKLIGDAINNGTGDSSKDYATLMDTSVIKASEADKKSVNKQSKKSFQDNAVKFDKTKSGKVGGIQVGKEIATVVKTPQQGAKKLKEVSDPDTGEKYDIYTSASSSSPDGIVAVKQTKDLSQMSESEIQSRMKQVTTRIEEVSKEMNNNPKSSSQLNSVATPEQKKEYDALVKENAKLMIELGKRQRKDTSKFDGDTVIDALNGVNQGVTKRFSTPGSSNIKNIAMNISSKKEFMNIVSKNNGVINNDSKDNGTNGNFTVNGHKVDFSLKGKKLVLSFDLNSTGSDKNDVKQKDSSVTSTSSSSISFDLPSGKNTKQAVTDLLASHSRSDIMSAAKSAGITWKENAHEGINWMRASMAIQKYMSK